MRTLSTIVSILLFSIVAQATPVLKMDQSGRWTGATGVTVLGVDYDLSFQDGMAPASTFTDIDTASAANIALAMLQYSSPAVYHPELITGCGPAITGFYDRCVVMTSFDDGNGPFAWANMFLQSVDPDAGVGPTVEIDGPWSIAGFDTAQDDWSVWAVWSPTPTGPTFRRPATPSADVPELSSLAFLIIGLSLFLLRR